MSVVVSFDEVKFLADFVKRLIMRKQIVAAVSFSFAYNLTDKDQLVNMLREHVRNAKLICVSSCKETNSVEIKVLLFFLLKFYFIKHSILTHTLAS